MPLFSVVIPLYNKEKHISDTLTSVFHQTLSDFEVIVVNDGSTDGSLAVVNSLNDPRLSIYTKANGGVSDARNYGIAKAQGDLIALLDADDKWEPEFLQEMQSIIDKYPNCGLYASAFKKLKEHKAILIGDRIPEGTLENFFEIKLKHLIPCSSAVVVPKKVFEDVGGFPVGMIGGEDDYTWSKIAVKYKIAYTPKVLVWYNERFSSANARRGKMDTCKESWFDLYEDGEGSFYRNEYIARKALYAGIRYAYHPNQQRSIEIEKLTRFTVLSKKLWWDLFFLNRLPFVSISLLRHVLPKYKKLKYMVYKLGSDTRASFLQLW
jgi:glycosyltransferase involved in cell wall biosynthesis